MRRVNLVFLLSFACLMSQAVEGRTLDRLILEINGQAFSQRQIEIYQAIRIEVNQEIEVLKEFLTQTEELLVSGGRLSVISYHSLEDRLVKRFIRNGMFEGEPERDFFGNFVVPFKIIEKLIVPSAAEIEINNRARSAKLRVAEKK